MRTILYATDYSENSIAALKMAKMLCDKLSATLFVLHVFDINRVLVSAVSLTSAKMEKKTFEENREKLSIFCEKHLGKPLENQKIELLVDENPIPDESIREVAKKINADLVVVGAKGGSLIKEIIMGSTTKNLLGKAGCPVVAVPPNTKINTLETVVYATDFEQSDVFAIQFLVENIIQPFNATLQVIHISTKEEYAGEEQMAWFKELLQEKVDYKQMKFSIEFSEDIFGTLLNYVDDVRADMLVMLERGQKGIIKSITHRDLVKQVMSKGNFPILSLNKENL